MKLSKEQLKELLVDYKPKNYDYNNLRFTCPWCNKDECFISTSKENHPWQCWRKKKCGQKGYIDTLLKKIAPDQSISKDIGNIKESIKINQIVPESLYDSIDNDNVELNLDIEEIKLPMGFRRIYEDEYLKTRGFDEDDFTFYNIGITKLERKLIGYVIFAIYQDYKIVGYVSRYRADKKTCDKLKKLRYKNSNSEFAKILGNHDNITNGVETIILVEGLIDEKNITKKLNLKLNDKTKCCFTFKCHVSDEQIQRLKNKGVKNLILLYDPDVINEIKKSAIKLSKHFNVKVCLIDYLNDNGELKDPAELELDEIHEIMNKSYTPMEFYTKQVQISI